MAETASSKLIDDLVGKAVDEFFQQTARGERPQLDQFVAQYPQISDLLRTVIPALQAAEDTSDATGNETLSNAPPRQLGDFRILRQIGRGGMGIVYEAEQISMTRRVALKVLPLAGLVDELKIRRFQNEVRAVAALDHPNIVPVYMVGEDRGVHYYAMRLIRGRSLSEVIASLRHVHDGGTELDGTSMSQITRLGGPDEVSDVDFEMPPDILETDPCQDKETGSDEPVTKKDGSTIPHSSRREYFRSVAAIGIQAASALQHAHDEGIIHRDVKPANLLLDSSAKLYLTDFGLARIESDAGVTMSGDLIGTMRYMAPEQALAKRGVVDHRADIYSLAATLYELLTLRPAYLARDRQQLLSQIAFDEPKRLRRIDRDIPPELETIVHKAMSKDVRQRYSSAQELADDLRAHLENRPIKANPPTASEIIGKWTRRNPILTGASVITLSLVTLTLAVSMYFIAGERDIAEAQLVRATISERKAVEAQIAANSRASELARQNYLMHIAGADKALLENKLFPAETELEACSLEQQGWEHDFLTERLLASFPMPLSAHAPYFTRDGKHLIACEGFNTPDQFRVKIWDMESRQVVDKLTHDSPVNGYAISANENRIVCLDVKGSLIVWDLKSGHKRQFNTLGEEERRLRYFAISPDGRLVAAIHGDRSVVILVDTDNGQKRREFGPFEHIPGNNIMFSPDGHWIAIEMAEGQEPAILINSETGETGEVFSEERGNIKAFALGGQQLATCTKDGWINIWNWDGKRLSNVATWQAANQEILSAAFNADGTCLASSDNANWVKVWNIKDRKILADIEVRGQVYELAFRPSSHDREDMLAMGSPSSGVRVWRWRGAKNGTMVKPLTGAVEVAFSPDNKLILASTPMYFTGGMRHFHKTPKYSVESAVVLNAESGSEVLSTEEEVYAALWSPNGQEIIATPASGKTIRTYDSATGKRTSRTFPGHKGVFTIFQIDPSGRHLVSFSSDKMVRTFDFESGAQLYGHEVGDDRESDVFGGSAANFSPDARLIGLGTRSVEMWDTRSGTQVSLHKQRSNWPKHFTFSDDGKRVYVGSSGGLLTQLDTVTGDQTKRFIARSGYVLGIAIAPGEEQIVTGDSLGRVIVWDIASEQPLITLIDKGPGVMSVDWSGDGQRIVAGKEDGTIQIWTLPRSEQ